MKPAAAIIGRMACPLCPHEAAHVKQSAGKLPYLYCPECGCTLPARNGVQAGHMLAKTRPDKLAEAAPAPDLVKGPTAEAGDRLVPKPAPPKRASAWAPLLGALGQ